MVFFPFLNMKPKLSQSQKANLNPKIVGVVVVLLVLLTVILLIYSVLVPEAQTAGDSLNASNQCNDNGCFFNASSAPNCQANQTNTSIACTLGGASPIPLASLFSSTGVIFVIIMAALLIVLLLAFLPKGTKGK